MASRTAALLAGSTGCAMQRKQVATSLQHLVEGVTAIYPAGAVLGIVTGTETTKVRVALGDYDQMIDTRIAQIKATCGI